jgi:hypothetical protein
MCIRAYGPTVSGRNPETPDWDPYTDPPYTLAEGETLQQLELKATRQSPSQREEYHTKNRTTGAIGNVSIQIQRPTPSFRLLYCRHPMYMSRDKMWRKLDRVIVRALEIW